MKKFGDILLVIGAGMLCLIPAAHFARLGGVKGSGNPLLWIVAGGAALVIGFLARNDTVKDLRLLGHKIVVSYKAIAILTLNALVLFVCLDLAASTALKIRTLLSTPSDELIGEGAPREKISYYDSKDWARLYWNEFVRSRKQVYRPYVLWRRASFEGKTINIDQNGIRLTPGAECTADSFKVFTFGSSTMWGTGAPDWGTIASYLQASLKKLKGGTICVTNFGESAYVSTQSVIALLLQLQSGNVPNWVIFYHGPDDVVVGYESGRSDLHSNFDPMAARFEKREPQPSPFMEVIKSFDLFSLADLLVSKLGPTPQASPKPINYQSKRIDSIALSESIEQRYLSNYKMVAGLAREYHFEYFFFWPPHISVGDKPLTSEERTIKRGVDPNFLKLLRPVDQAIERVSPEYKNIYYMGKLFDEYPSLIWIDDFHVTPAGNQIIAEKMLEVIARSGTGEFRKKANDQTASR